MACEWLNSDAGSWRLDWDDTASKRRRDRRTFAEAIDIKLQMTIDSQSQIWARLCRMEASFALMSSMIGEINAANKTQRASTGAADQVKFVEVPKFVHIEVCSFH